MNQSQIEQITRLLNNELSSQEKAELEALLRQDEELAAEFAVQKRVSSLLKDFVVSRPVPVSKEAYWDNIRNRIRTQKNNIGTVKVTTSFLVRKWTTIAAAACIVLCCSVFYIPNVTQHSAKSDYYSEVETGDGISSTSLDGQTIHIEWIENAHPLPFES